MAKKRKNSNYVTDKVIARQMANKEAERKKEKTKKTAIWITSAVLLIALIVGVVAMGFNLGWWEYYEPTHHAVIEVEGYGSIHLELYGKTAPKTVANFVKLAQEGYYDGSTFHRVIAGFMAQGGEGDYDPDPVVGEFKANGFNNPIKHRRGVISMARANDYDSANAQFFIVHKTYPSLDGLYAAFGRVTEGMDVLDAICEAADPNASNGLLSQDDQAVITRITIHEIH